MNDNKYGFDIPIVLFTFKRLSTIELIFEQLQKIKPQLLYIFSDGARLNVKNEKECVDSVREYIKNAIDWECDSKLFFLDHNKGCDKNIREGLDKVFSEQNRAIVFEDDAIPTMAFFYYCQELLNAYAYDKRIQYIAGFNAIGSSDVIKTKYTFGKTVPLNGAFATWADRWNGCDFDLTQWPTNKQNGLLDGVLFSNELKRRYTRVLDSLYRKETTSWDYMFEYDMYENDRLAIVPQHNLATNYGFVEGAYHPQKKNEAKRFKEIMTAYSNVDPPYYNYDLAVERNLSYDRIRQEKLLSVNGTFVQRRLFEVYMLFKDFAYEHLPEKYWKALKQLLYFFARDDT